jgi:protease I
MKAFFVGCVLLSTLGAAIMSGEAVAMENLKGKRIVMIIAHENFRDEELNAPLAIFQNAGAEVIIASSELAVAKGKFGALIMPDILYSDIDPKKYDAVVFVGGPGAVQYLDDSQAHRIARETLSAGRVLAAICIAPAILAKAGVLKGKSATVFPSDQNALIDGGARYTAKGVEVDGSIVTADGPQSAAPFANEIVKLLK